MLVVVVIRCGHWFHSKKSSGAWMSFRKHWWHWKQSRDCFRLRGKRICVDEPNLYPFRKKSRNAMSYVHSNNKGLAFSMWYFGFPFLVERMPLSPSFIENLLSESFHSSPRKNVKWRFGGSRVPWIISITDISDSTQHSFLSLGMNLFCFSIASPVFCPPFFIEHQNNFFL